ncbi:hypothetical protein B566_EDAN017475, partial [Ephemera danica]
MLFWLWLLDARLPGDLGQVGEWLHQAEALILADDIPQLMNEETAGIISRKLEEHKSGANTLSEIQEEYTNLIEWLSKKTQYLEHLQQTQSLPLNYSDYITFKNEVDSKSSVYEKLKKLVDNQSMVAITLESWRVVEKLWSK